jgi:hypothetical protein
LREIGEHFRKSREDGFGELVEAFLGPLRLGAVEETIEEIGSIVGECGQKSIHAGELLLAGGEDGSDGRHSGRRRRWGGWRRASNGGRLRRSRMFMALLLRGLGKRRRRERSARRRGTLLDQWV